MAIINNNSRYRNIIISIGVFVALIAAMLFFTIYASSQLAQKTVMINEANRVSTASQTVIKDLFDLQNSYGESVRGAHISAVLDRLSYNIDYISSRLELLNTGGEVVDGDYRYHIPALPKGVSRVELARAQAQWQLLKPRIETYLANAKNPEFDSSSDLQQAAEQAKTSSLVMTGALEGLTATTYGDSEDQADLLRVIEIIGIITALSYFGVFVFFFMRRLRASDAETLAAQRETSEIMQTVSTGLFLLDKDLNIGNQYSAALENIIGSSDLAGNNLTHVLRNRISDKDLQTTRQFVEQLYNPRVKEKLVNSLNPLNRVAFSSDGAGRYLDFKFSRVYEGDKIARILVNVEDISDAVRLEKRLEQERMQNDLQIDMLTTILNANPAQITSFIKTTRMRIDRINDILKSPGSTQFGLEGKLKSISREMHSLKGESSALKLHGFVKIAEEAENKLGELREKERLSGNDFLPLTVHLDSLLELSNTIGALGERIQGVVHAQKPKEITVSSAVVSDTPTPSMQQDLYQNFVQEIGERQGKLVKLDTSNYHHQDILVQDVQLVQDIVIQLIRNAIVHGIESPERRVQMDKSEIGRISLSVRRDDDKTKIVVEDDGAGIDVESIRQKMLDSGKFDVAKVAALNHRQLIGMLFNAGFSTRDVSDEDGGRGVGLDVVKDLVNARGGKIDVKTELGQRTQFIIHL